MKIPLIDLKAQFINIEDEIRAAIDKVLESGQYILGQEVQNFEEKFADYCGAEFGVAVNSGTSALHLALLAAGIGPGDEVITVSATFVATVAAIRYTGAKAVMVDVDEQTLTMDIDQLEAAITPASKAILPVHLYGHPAKMIEINEIARRHKLQVIEDAAQAHGAEIKGNRIGGFGDYACFSFYPSKNLGAMGEGGMILTSNAENAARLRMLRDWGQSQKYHHDILGFNYRMDGFQGAILGAKLNHLDKWVEQRRAIAEAYTKLISNEKLRLPFELEGNRHAYYVYVLRSEQRDKLIAHLNKLEIGTGIHYPHPVHLEAAFKDLAYKAGDFPISEKSANEVLSIPIFPEMSMEQVEIVAEAINSF